MPWLAARLALTVAGGAATGLVAWLLGGALAGALGGIAGLVMAHLLITAALATGGESDADE